MPAPPERLYRDDLGWRNKLDRMTWGVARFLLFSWTPTPFFGGWRRWVLRCFGARIGKGCRIDSSCSIWLPRNLTMGDFACLAQGVDCYNVAPIRIGSYATVSQRSFLCTASHDTRQLARPLVFAPIEIGEHAWICAEAFVGPGVTVATGAVLAARSVAMRDIGAWSINAGVPAKRISERHIDTEPGFVTAPQNE